MTYDGQRPQQWQYPLVAQSPPAGYPPTQQYQPYEPPADQAWHPPVGHQLPPGFQPRRPQKQSGARATWLVLAAMGAIVLVVAAVLVTLAVTHHSPDDATAAHPALPTLAASESSAAPAAAVSAPADTEPALPSSLPAQTVYRVGQSVPLTQSSDSSRSETGEATIVVNAIRLNRQTGNPYETPDNGQFVVADITIRATSGTYTYDQSQFTLTTPDLRSWQAEFVNYFDPPLRDGTLAAGQALRGNVSFDVERGAVSGVNLTNSDDGSIIATWKP